MFAALRRRLAGADAPSPIAELHQPAAAQSQPPPIPLPALLARDEALRQRSAHFAAAADSQQPVLDQALADLSAAGRLRPDQLAYAADHRRRFGEALHAIHALLSPDPAWPACRVMEVGSSITPMLFHSAFPALRLTAACLFRHPQLEGIVERAVQVDLEKLDLRGEAGFNVPGGPVQDLHMVMLCEVLEHLVVNPANLFRMLATTLRPGGVLYVTTPNFLRASSRAALAAGRNPQPLYRPEFRPEDRFHHHVREYTMAELLDAMQAAGLAVEVAQYSACWDSPEAVARLPDDMLQNLVVVGRKPMESAPGA